MENNKRVDKKKQEDIALTRALIWFAAAMVVEFLLLLVNKYYINFTADSASIRLALTMGTVLKVATALGLLAAVLCGVWTWKQGKKQGSLPFLCVVLTAVMLTIGISSGLIVLFYRAAVQLLYIMVPAGAVLALVYYLYQREFFFSTCGIAVGMLGLWLVRKNIGTHDLIVTLYMVLAAVVLFAMIVLTIKLKQNGGAISIKERQYEVMPKQSNFLLIILSCVVSVVTLVAALLLGGTVAFYLLFVLVAWLFVLLVYYTVKMM